MFLAAGAITISTQCCIRTKQCRRARSSNMGEHSLIRFRSIVSGCSEPCSTHLVIVALPMIGSRQHTHKRLSQSVSPAVKHVDFKLYCAHKCYKYTLTQVAQPTQQQSVTADCFSGLRSQSYQHCRVQPTVTFPIGDHVNVLHDYKKMGPSTILKLLSCRCQHIINMLVEFCQNHIFLTLLKQLNVLYPSIFTNVCINYYAHVPCGEKIPKNPSAYLNHLKIDGYTANMFYQQICQCICSNAVMSDVI